jgi:hypothetical protein
MTRATRFACAAAGTTAANRSINAKRKRDMNQPWDGLGGAELNTASTGR